jgi:hypothetical protein
MADLTAADVTVNQTPQDVDFLQFNKVVFPTIAFGDGIKTYGAGNGIPMPDLSQFGFHKEIRRAKVIQPAKGYVYHLDRANHKLRIFHADYDAMADGALVEVPPGFAPAATVLELELTGQ